MRAPADARGATAARDALRLPAVAGDEAGVRSQAVAVEAPLEIRLSGETLAVTMRTPGADRELALGFLLSEGVIASLADVGGLAPCGRPGEPSYGHTLDIAPGPGTAFDLERAAARRGTLISTACGVCGRRSIEDLLARCEPVLQAPRLPWSLLASSTSVLAGHQPGFAHTGGLHAAAVLDARGALLSVHEDVGRHNAVDKAVGSLLLQGLLPLREDGEPEARPSLLVVSGRVSFEIVQKAVAARIAAVCGVSAPTSLAIDLATQARVALAAFVRDGTLTLYGHRDHIAL